MRFAGGGKSLESFQHRAKKMGIADCTKFLGFIANDKLDQEFADADIFAMPSNGEGFGLVYLQAMANSLPCICGDGDAAKEVVVDGETGIVVPYGNPSKLADELAQLLKDPKKRLRMGEAGMKRYKQLYTEDAFNKRFLDFINQFDWSKNEF